MVKKKNNQQMYWFIGGLVVLFLTIGVSQGWFTETETLSITIPQSQSQFQILGSCLEVCDANNFDTGYPETTSCTGGETRVTYGYAGQPSLFTCCCSDRTISPDTEDTCTEIDGGNNIDVPGITYFNDVGYMDFCLATDSRMVHEYYCDGTDLMEDNYMCDVGYVCVDTRSGGYCQAPPEGYEVGDNIGSGSSGSGTGGFDDDDSINVITMDWTTGGPYILGAKITRSWDYIGNDCYGPEQFPMEWSLYDSNGMAWQSYDYFPVNNVVDYVCPVVYHEDANWKFVVKIGIQDCDVEYSWQVQPYICEENN